MLHPAEHRGYRELTVAARQLLARWSRLTEAVADTDAADALDRAAEQVRELLAVVGPRIAAYDLHSGRAARASDHGRRRPRRGDRPLARHRRRGSLRGARHRAHRHSARHLSALAEAPRTGTSPSSTPTGKGGCGPRSRRSARPPSTSAATPTARATLRLLDLRPGRPPAGWALGTLGEWFDRRASGTPEQETKEPQD